MSALPAPATPSVDGLVYRAMTVHDVAAVCAIEQRIYPYPWTRGNFIDSIESGYRCSVMEQDGVMLGYGVLSAAAGESHLLNLSVDAPWQRRGLGRALLLHHLDLARAGGAGVVLLEVRPSNGPARALYAAFGFVQAGIRRGYYPDPVGREDALVLALDL